MPGGVWRRRQERWKRCPDDELDALREKVLAGDPGMAADPDWFTWAKWLFEAPDERTVAPGAKTTVARLIARLRAADNIEDLHQAVRLSPTDAPTFARLGTRYQAMAPVRSRIRRSGIGRTRRSGSATGRSPWNPRIPMCGRCGAI